ncbi:MAG: cytochrome c biogenesis protein CcsA [Mariprofundaceae bacterium]|nr:cytochrome c biogenesis protein CcsA [Mariprofundaceae bacterium]
MTSTYLFLAAGVLTLVSAYVVWADVWSNTPASSASKGPLIALLLIASLSLSLWGCFKLAAVSDQGIYLSLASAATIAIILVQSLYLIGVWQHGIRGLGLFLLPLTAVLLLLIPALPESAADHWIHTSSILESSHLLLSLLAYATLTLAAIHALMHLQLDSALKKKQLSPIMQAMPSLFEIETHLFAQVRWATWLLAIGILTGLSWQWVEFQHFALFNHKVLLSLFAFGVLALLLAKRKKAGWHGRRSSHMVLSAYALLLLGYFGVKLINSWLG